MRDFRERLHGTALAETLLWQKTYLAASTYFPATTAVWIVSALRIRLGDLCGSLRIG